MYKEFPKELVPNSNSMILEHVTFNFESAFTGVEQHVTHPGARWTLNMNFTPLKDNRKRILSVFLNSLGGGAEFVKVYDHAREGKPPAGAPVVSGDGQTGRKLLTQGWLPNQRVLELGDLFTVNNELKEVREDIWSDDNGFATLSFNPPLRKSPPNSAEIITENPYMIATLGSKGVEMTQQALGFGTFEKITFKEAIYK